MLEGMKVPTEEQVAEFFNIVDDTLKKKPEAVIFIHCTHGINRTGTDFLIDGWCISTFFFETF